MKMFRRFAPTFVLCAAASFAAIPPAFAQAQKPDVPGLSIFYGIGNTVLLTISRVPQTTPPLKRYTYSMMGSTGTNTIIFSDENVAVSHVHAGGQAGASGFLRSVGHPVRVRVRADNTVPAVECNDPDVTDCVPQPAMGGVGDWSPWNYAVNGTPIQICPNNHGVRLDSVANGFRARWVYASDDIGAAARPDVDGFDIRWRRVNPDGSKGIWSLYPQDGLGTIAPPSVCAMGDGCPVFDREQNKTAPPATARVSFAAACGFEHDALDDRGGSFVAGCFGKGVSCSHIVNGDVFIDDTDFGPRRGQFEVEVSAYNEHGRNRWVGNSRIVTAGTNITTLSALEVASPDGIIFPLFDGASTAASPLTFMTTTANSFAKVPATAETVVIKLTTTERGATVAQGATRLPEVFGAPGTFTFTATPAEGITTYDFTVTSANTAATQNHSLEINRFALAPTSLQAEVIAVAETPAERNYAAAAGDIINVMPAFDSARLSYTLTLPYPVTTFRFIAPVNDADLIAAENGIEVFDDAAAKLYSYPVFENAADIIADTSADYTETIAVGEHPRNISFTDSGGGMLNYEIGVTRETEEFPPAKPTALSATRTETQLALTWTPPQSAQPITTYFARWADAATDPLAYINDGGENGINTGGGDATYTIAAIDIATTYAIQVRAKSLRGIGEWSDALIRRGEFAPGAPAMVDGNYVGTQIALTWIAPPPVHPQITSYRVRWANASAPDTWLNTNAAAGIDTGGTDETYVIRNLDQNLAYAVQVAAVNAVGAGAWSDVVNLAQSGRPAAPTMLGATRDDAKITLTWTAPASAAAITTYFVRVAVEPNLDAWQGGAGGVDTKKTETNHEFSFNNAAFKKNFAYAMQVSAANIHGTGLWSETLFNGAGDLRFVSDDETPDLFFHTKPLGRVITLREATDGIPPYQYALLGNVPPGLNFDANTRELSGAPTAESAAVTLTYRITDRTEDRTATVITDEFDVTAVTVTTDVDGDNKSTAADGILIARYLLGVTDEALTFAQTATDAADIKNTLETAVKTTALNVNADTVTDADDGILIARYLLGMRNAALELVTNTAAEIAEKVEALLPAQ